MPGIDAKSPGDALACAEQVDENRHLGGHAIGLDGRFEQKRGAVALKHAPVNLRDLVDDRDRLADADKLALGLEVREKAAQAFEKRLVATQQRRGLRKGFPASFLKQKASTFIVLEQGSCVRPMI